MVRIRFQKGSMYVCVLLVPYKIDDTLTIKRVRFTPIEIGPHCLNVKFGSDTIPGRIKFMINFQSFSFKRDTNEIDGERYTFCYCIW
jgi:hypothetical protein